MLEKDKKGTALVLTQRDEASENVHPLVYCAIATNTGTV